MAAFEAVSRVTVGTIGFDSEYDIDYRQVLLPDEYPPDDGFDPRDHREPRVVITPKMAYFNLLRVPIGLGLLGMPMAISQTGSLLGLLMTIFVCILLISTNTTLLWCTNEISRQLKIRRIPYRYAFRVALLHGPPVLRGLGESGPTIVALGMVLSQLSICTVLVIFTADNLRDLMDWPNAKLAFIALYVPVVLLEIFMKSLKKVSYMVMMGNVLCVIGASIATYEISKEGRFSNYTLMTNNMLQVVQAFGIIVFTFSAVGVILACDKSLKNPKIMPNVIKVGTAIPGAIGALFGVFGCYAFGTMEENILRYMDFCSPTTLVMLALYTFISATLYPLQVFPGVAMISEVIVNHDPLVKLESSLVGSIEYISRPVFVTITFIIAYIIPFQGPFVAFVGNFFTILLSFIFPSLMEFCILYPDRYGPYHYILIKDILIVTFGFIAWLMGVALCGYLLYIRFLTYFSLNTD